MAGMVSMFRLTLDKRCSTDKLFKLWFITNFL